MGTLAFPMIGAHTGCDNTPYNTVESFMEGIRLGADVIEVDLRVARDGTVVLLHDDSPYLHEYDYEDLNSLPVRSRISPLYERLEIVRLADVLPIAKQYGVQLNLDLKTTDAIEPCIRLVREHEMAGQVYITGSSDGMTSRNGDFRVVFNTATKLTPEESASYSLFAEKVCREGVEGRYYGLNMHHATCRREVIELAHRNGLAVWVYTVNDPDTMKQLIESGVDAMTTKEVSRLIALKNLSLS
ncbi:glycerophosphodiester phosphodiesterase [Paenibacillus sp. NPDC056579]|uniref:glycerophosphodiester phosphodiesterase n=1 Tax=Paenibacillus sp. NPDC056579 TaxID=3345871 RepID=UPI0036A258BC